MVQILYKDFENQNDNATLSGMFENFPLKQNVVNSPFITNYAFLDGDGIDLNANDVKLYEENDYIGEISSTIADNVGLIDFNLTLKGNFKYLNKGITLNFYGGTFLETEVTYNGNDNVIGTETLLNPKKEKSFYFVPKFTQGVKSIDIKVTKIEVPNSRLKISSIILGDAVYKLEKVKDLSLVEEINILSDDLPANEFDFTIVAKEPIKNNAEITIYSNRKFYGLYFVQNVERLSQEGEESVYKVSTTNLVGMLGNVPFETAGMPTTANLLSTIIMVNFIDYDVMPPKFDAGEGNFDTLLDVKNKNGRYAFCNLGWALGCMIDNSRNNGLHFKRMPDSISYKIMPDEILGKSTLDRTEIITNAEIFNLDGYNQVTDRKEMKLTVEPNSKTTLKFDKYTLAVVQSGDATLSKISPYQMILESGNDTTVTLLYNEYEPKYKTENVINERKTSKFGENTKKYDMFNAIANDEQGTLISRASDVKNYIQSLGKIKAKIILKGERVGDLVEIDTAWDGKLKGIITKMNLHFGYDDVADVEIQEWGSKV